MKLHADVWPVKKRTAIDGAYAIRLHSAGERVQRQLPDSKVVKAFNTITASHMVHPQLPDGAPDMLIAGDDTDAKAQVDALLQSFRNNHWTHGFSLLGQKPA